MKSQVLLRLFLQPRCLWLTAVHESVFQWSVPVQDVLPDGEWYCFYLGQSFHLDMNTRHRLFVQSLAVQPGRPVHLGGSHLCRTESGTALHGTEVPSCFSPLSLWFQSRQFRHLL